MQHEPRIQQLSDDLEQLGLHPFHLPLGVQLTQDAHGRPTTDSPCIRCDRMDGFPCLLGAKADAEWAVIRPALAAHPNLTLMTRTTAERLLTDASGRAVTGVAVTLSDGSPGTFTADIVVLSAGAILSAALLLKSANDKHPHGLANSSDMVGRNYMRHNNLALIAFSREPNPTVFQKTLALNDFYGPSEHWQYPMGNIQMLGKSDDWQIKGAAPRGLGWAPPAPYGEVARHSIDSGCPARPSPRRTAGSRCGGRHDPAGAAARQQHRRPHPAAPDLQGMLGKLGMLDTTFVRSLYLHKAIDHAATAHQAGTARFGTDPTASVLDVHCKAHDLDNLYVVDGSFMPSIGAVNPTLTIIANALPAGRRSHRRAHRNHLLKGALPCRESRTTPSSATCTRPPWSAATGRSTGSACPGSTPRACFAALLDDDRRRPLAARARRRRQRAPRRYRGDTLVLETEWDTDDGHACGSSTSCRRAARPPTSSASWRACRAASAMRIELRLRFDYGRVVPWVRHLGDGLAAIAGPDAVWLTAAGRRWSGHDRATRRRLHGRAGDRVPFVLTWHPRHGRAPRPVDAEQALAATDATSGGLDRRCTLRRPVPRRRRRSLLTLKALTYAPTGGIVAAATTSLPEQLGGVAQLGLPVLLAARRDVHPAGAARRRLPRRGAAWRDWLLRAVAGRPGRPADHVRPRRRRGGCPSTSCLAVRLRGLRPVRVGNAAAGQFQLDVWGEVLDGLHLAREAGCRQTTTPGTCSRRCWTTSRAAWERAGQRAVGGARRRAALRALEGDGLGRRSTGRCSAVETFGLDGPVDRWRALREQIHDEVCAHGSTPNANTFTQSYGSAALDAACC